MKVIIDSLLLCSLCFFIQNAYTANPSIPFLECYFNDDFSTGNYYRVNLKLYQGVDSSVRDQETQYIAATFIDAGGSFGTPNEACGSSIPFDINSNTGVQLNFIVDATTGDLITDSVVIAAANAVTIPSPPDPPYIDDPAAVCTDGLRVVIQTFTSADTSTPGMYSVYFDFTLGNPGTIRFEDAETTNLLKGQTAFLQPTWVVPLPIDLTAPTIDATLEVIDTSNTAVTSMGFGDKFQLKLTVTVTTGANYISGLDVAGAIVKQCKVATDPGITANVVTFIDNYCSVDTNIFSTSTIGAGFTKQSSTSAVMSNEYIAVSHDLEAGIFFPTPDTTTINQNLYFQCTVEYNCYDATDTTAKCGGDHCTGAKRKRRSVETSGEHRVATKLTVVDVAAHDKFEIAESPQPCSETLTFKATFGVLGTTAVLLFFGVIFSFYDMKGAQRKTKVHA